MLTTKQISASNKQLQSLTCYPKILWIHGPYNSIRGEEAWILRQILCNHVVAYTTLYLMQAIFQLLCSECMDLL